LGIEPGIALAGGPFETEPALTGRNPYTNMAQVMGQSLNGRCLFAQKLLAERNSEF